MVCAAAILWGTWSLYLRPTGLSGVWTAPIVLAVIGVTALPLVRLDPREVRWDRSTLGLLALYAISDAVNAGTFFFAMQVTTLAVAVLTHCTAPILVALLAPRFDGLRVRGSLAAAAVALLGLVLLLRPWAPREGDAEGSVLLGAALGLASAVGYASAVLSAKALSARVGVGRATAYHALLAAALFAPLAAALPEPVEASDLGILAAGALLSGTLATWLFLAGMRAIGAARAAVLSFLEPLVAVLVGWLVWDETLGLVSIAGGALVVGAAAFVARAKPEPA